MTKVRHSAAGAVFFSLLAAAHFHGEAAFAQARHETARSPVASVNPGISVVGVESGTTISIDLAGAVDPATVTNTSVRVYGRWSGPAAGRLSVENGNSRIRFDPSEAFFAGEYVTVSLSDHIRFADSTHLDGGFSWGFWIATVPALLEIREIDRIAIRRPGESHIQSYGAYAGDLNDDGWSDLVIPNEQSRDLRVFLNNKGSYGPFAIYPIPASILPSTNEGGDFNGDGSLDVAVGSGGNENVYVVLGDGSGALTVNSPVRTEGNVRGLCVLDVDADGDDDIVTASRATSSLYLLVNNGDGTFRNRIPMDGHGDQETSCAVGDANGDGIMDLFVGSLSSGHVALLLGNGRGGLNLSDRVVIEGGPWMLAAGDLNGDGFADVAAAGSQSNTVAAVLSDGQGLLENPVHYTAGLFPLAIDLGDLDGDSDLDMVSSNFNSSDFTVFENLGDGSFRRDRSYRAGGAGSCAILHDRDNDGDLDITAIDELDDILILYETDTIPTTIEDENADSNGRPQLQIWPNPASERVTLSLEGTFGDPSRVVVHDLVGRVVHEMDATTRQRVRNMTWNTSQLPSGIYLATLLANGTTITRPLVVRH